MDDTARVRARRRWYDILECPEQAGRGARLLHLGLMALIALNVLAVLLETVEHIHAPNARAFADFDRFSVAVFTVEYLARIWVSPEGRPDVPAGTARRRHLRSPMAIVDLLAIAPFYLSFIVGIDLRVLRSLRLLRVFKLTRYTSAMSLLLDVLRDEASSFFAGLFILFVLLILASSGAYLAEHEVQPDTFGSIPEAMWWAMATLTTVGYGDVTPVTTAGRVFGGLVTVIGVGMAALPAGILASGLNDRLHARRDNLRNQFRLALEDGTIDAREEVDIERLRIELGIRREVAMRIRTEVLLQERDRRRVCPNCGYTPGLTGPDAR